MTPDERLVHLLGLLDGVAATADRVNFRGVRCVIVPVQAFNQMRACAADVPFGDQAEDGEEHA